MPFASSQRPSRVRAYQAHSKISIGAKQPSFWALRHLLDCISSSSQTRRWRLSQLIHREAICARTRQKLETMIDWCSIMWLGRVTIAPRSRLNQCFRRSSRMLKIQSREIAAQCCKMWITMTLLAVFVRQMSDNLMSRSSSALAILTLWNMPVW